MSEFDSFMYDVQSNAVDKFLSSVDYVFDFENILSIYLNNDRVGYIMATPENKALHIHCLHQSNNIYSDVLYADESDFRDRETLQATISKRKEYAASVIFDELFIRWTKELDS